MVDVSDKVYTKQEQVPATAEITEVAPNILRTQLPIDMPGLGHVNMYVLEDSRGVAVVDPGLPGKATWQAINNRLAEIGVPLRRVHSIIVTHSHPDHFGGAGRLRAENDEPNGPKSTIRPQRSTAATAAVTWAPGDPSTNGSTVNSTFNMVPALCLGRDLNNTRNPRTFGCGMNSTGVRTIVAWLRPQKFNQQTNDMEQQPL